MGEHLERIDCAVESGRIVTPCSALESCITNRAAAISKKKGVALWTMVRVGAQQKTEISRVMVGLICDAHPNGILFSYCPFCGTSISAPFDGGEAEAEVSAHD